MRIPLYIWKQFRRSTRLGVLRRSWAYLFGIPCWTPDCPGRRVHFFQERYPLLAGGYAVVDVWRCPECGSQFGDGY